MFVCDDINEVGVSGTVWTSPGVLPFVRRRLRCRQGAIPEALRQASVRRSLGLSTSVPLPRGHASSRNHALVDGTFRVSVREPEREIVRWGPGRAWRAFLANGSIAATGRAAPGRRPPRISSDGLQTAGRRATCSQPHLYASAARTVGVRSSTRDEMSLTNSILRTVFSIADWRSSEMSERVRLRYLSRISSSPCRPHLTQRRMTMDDDNSMRIRRRLVTRTMPTRTTPTIPWT